MCVFNDAATTEIYTLSLHDALPISGEQAVAVGVVQLVTGPPAGRPDGARHDGGPGVEVALGVADDRGPARGTGGRVHPPDLVLRDGEHPERVEIGRASCRERV